MIYLTVVLLKQLSVASKCLRRIHSKYFENTLSVWKTTNKVEEKCWQSWRNFQESTWHFVPSCPLQKQSLSSDLVYESCFISDKTNLIGSREVKTDKCKKSEDSVLNSLSFNVVRKFYWGLFHSLSNFPKKYWISAPKLNPALVIFNIFQKTSAKQSFYLFLKKTRNNILGIFRWARLGNFRPTTDKKGKKETSHNGEFLSLT